MATCDTVSPVLPVPRRDWAWLGAPLTGLLMITALCLRSAAIPAAPEAALPEQSSLPGCHRLIDQAVRDANQAVVDRCAHFQEEFARRRELGVRPFAEAVTSWGGKWRAIKTWFPGTDADGHARWIGDQVATHLFSEAELGALIQGTVDAAILDIEAIQNRLALDLATIIDDPALLDGDPLRSRQQFGQLLDAMVAGGEWDATKTIGNLTASEIAAWIGSQVLIKLGVSTGILAAGAANSWWSFGASIVLGIVVDVIWTWIDDPVGDVEAEIRTALERISFDCWQAMKWSLHDLVEDKARLWRGAVARLFAVEEVR